MWPTTVDGGLLTSSSFNSSKKRWQHCRRRRRRTAAVRVPLEVVPEDPLADGTYATVQRVDHPGSLVLQIVTFLHDRRIGDGPQATPNHLALFKVVVVVVVDIRAKAANTFQHYAAGPQADVVGLPLFPLKFGTIKQERIVELRHRGSLHRNHLYHSQAVHLKSIFSREIVEIAMKSCPPRYYPHSLLQQGSAKGLS